MTIANLGDLIRVNAQQHENDVAFVQGARTQTFGQFNSRVNKLIDALTAHGLRKGDRIAMLSSNQIEFAESYGAAEKGGFIAVPLNHRLDRSDIAYIVDDADVSAIITEDRLQAQCDGLKPQSTFVFSTSGDTTLSSYEQLVNSGGDAEPDVTIGPRDVVYMMYTGGTTGRSKGVLLDHYGQMMNARTMLIEGTVTKDDTLMTVMPLNHIGGKNFANAHFHRGTKNVLLSAFEAQAVLDTLIQHDIRCTLLAPTMIKMLIDHLGDTPFTSNLKTVYYSSAPMPVSLLRQAIAKFGRIFMQFYGLTESGPSATALHKEDHKPDGTPQEQRRLASAGRAMIYNEVQVVDAEDRPLPVGSVGEVRIRAEQIMQGYWRNPKATGETLRNGWIYSGDYGEIDEDGYVYIVGRKKDVIISGGENIYPREIEELLNAHPAVKEVAVVGAPDEKWGEAVCAVLVLNDGHTLSADDVIAHCRQHLASYKKPRQVHFWTALPRSSLGKIVKSEIRGGFWRGHDRKI